MFHQHDVRVALQDPVAGCQRHEVRRGLASGLLRVARVEGGDDHRLADVQTTGVHLIFASCHKCLGIVHDLVDALHREVRGLVELPGCPAHDVVELQ
eukprot:9433733-Heterocapsa_arctica.AAC.1